MSKEAYYFSHDSNAKSDPKIMAMISDYGMEGYGRFWVVIEMLREQDSFELPLKKYVINALAMQTQCDVNAMQSYIEACINDYELFESDGDSFWSNSLKKRMDKKNEKSEKAKKAAQARWKKASDNKGSSENDMQQECTSNADAVQNDAIKGKERKGKEKKEKDLNNHLHNPRLAEIENTLFENGFGMSTGIAREEINQTLEKGPFEEPIDIIIEAIKEAARNNKKSWAYVRRVLIAWEDKGIKTKRDALAIKKQWEQDQISKQKQKRFTQRKSTNERNSPIPKWMKEQPSSQNVDQQIPGREEELKKLLAFES